jgi:uncharacterized membrane protein YkvA (DUF1232 family)
MNMAKLHYLKYTLKYLKDPAVPFYKKIWIYLVILYILSPFDLIPDPILGIGWLDDAIVFIVAALFLAEVLQGYAGGTGQPRRSRDGKTIENVPYKVHDENK